MRCWHPRAKDVIKKVKEFNPEEIILLPLYPQFSAATSGSSINEWSDLCKKENFNVKTKIIYLGSPFYNRYRANIHLRDPKT